MNLYKLTNPAILLLLAASYAAGQTDKPKPAPKVPAKAPAPAQPAKPPAAAPAPPAARPGQPPAAPQTTPRPAPPPAGARQVPHTNPPVTPGRGGSGITGGGVTGTRPASPSPAARPPAAGSGITGGGRSPAPQQQRPAYVPGRGTQSTINADGTQRHYNPQTQTAVHTDRTGRIATVERPGMRATGFGADGRSAHIEHARADGSRMTVDRGFRGERRVEMIRPGGTRVVTVGRRGFVERPIAGRPGYVSRTYVIGGRPEVRVYRTYVYRDTVWVGYVPRIYYQPAFYAWAYQPWGAPAVYAWGWGPAPWFYGPYFAPEPVYPIASLWLTDYLLAENLRLAYENQMAAMADGQFAQMPPVVPGANVELTPEVKQMIAEEVQRQLAAEQVAAQSAMPQPSLSAPQGMPPALDPLYRVYVVSSNLTVADAEGRSCGLTPGDVIERITAAVPGDANVPVSVVSSKAGDCPVNFATALDIATLQDMHNQFREQIAAGMERLAATQGKGGVPMGPAAGPRAAAEGQAVPAADAADLLAAQAREADQTEAEIRQAANGGQ